MKEYFKILTIFIALVWLVNGLFCKVLNLLPRHQEIVSRILSQDYSRSLTIIIGSLEILMALWIAMRWKVKLNAGLQIIVILTMNIIEFLTVPDFLMWGRWNMLFALLFCALIFVNSFYLYPKQKNKRV